MTNPLPPSLHICGTFEAFNIAYVDILLSNCTTLLETLRHNLFRAQRRMKFMVDHHCRDLQLCVGELVMVKLQPL